ncbi:MAG TPA: YlxR family protein [Myxococcota bacterium]|nr:YlxR family protein [Myxococcota bacterium]HOC99182.1 YlxR family protein [Myxococcota bacterium]HOH77254.1 YlxR family protein [Myxococcota bacterium]HPV04472.1 YlxR family protein [Myxococcota bacterium]
MTDVPFRPERKCVGCGKLRDRAELARVVIGADGAFELDTALARGGRGAYVCRNPECLKRAVLRGHLARALRVPPGPDREAVLARLGEALK